MQITVIDVDALPHKARILQTSTRHCHKFPNSHKTKKAHSIAALNMTASYCDAHVWLRLLIACKRTDKDSGSRVSCDCRSRRHPANNLETTKSCIGWIWPITNLVIKCNSSDIGRNGSRRQAFKGHPGHKVPKVRD